MKLEKITSSIALISALRAHLIFPVPDCILIALADLGRSETTMLSAMFKLFMAFTGQYDSPALAEWTSSERDNLLALAALLSEKDKEERLEKAEILRELGDWRGALALLPDRRHTRPNRQEEQLLCLVARHSSIVEAWW